MAARCETPEKQVSSKISPELLAHLAEEEKKSLEAIKDDLCQWITKLLDEPVSLESFWKKLDNGILLCKLANLLQKTSREREVRFSTPELRYNERAASESFPARDNASKFINWCRANGIEEAVIFESEGLVLHKDEKRVILCLLDVGRLAGRVGLPSPELVQHEQEIDAHAAANSPKNQNNNNSHHASSIKKGPAKLLDEKVASLKDCKCNQNPLKTRTDENGRYIVSGGSIKGERILYARLLKDRVMVRVGGGWTTLQHFLLEHDPCRVLNYHSGDLLHHAINITVK